MLLDLQPSDVEQGEFDLEAPGADLAQLTTAVDQLKDRYANNTVSIASGVAGDRSVFS